MRIYAVDDNLVFFEGVGLFVKSEILLFWGPEQVDIYDSMTNEYVARDAPYLSFTRKDSSTFATFVDAQNYLIQETTPAVDPEADKRYTHVQAVASAIWVVPHNLGKRPAVTVVDSLSREIEADILHQDLNNLLIQFGGIAIGEAYCN